MRKLQPQQPHLQSRKSPLPTLPSKSVPKPPAAQQKSIKRTPLSTATPMPQPEPSKEQRPPLPACQIIKNCTGIDIQPLSFEQAWAAFLKESAPAVKFHLMMPEPVGPIGGEVLADGGFYVKWLSVLEKNCYINMDILFKNVREKNLPNIATNKQLLQKYLDAHIIAEQPQTPSKPPPTQPLKRSILKQKNSQKKVQFGGNQIIYPILEDYSPLLCPCQPSSSRQNIVKQIREKQGFLLDYFEINEIYLLGEVEVVGILHEYEDIYAIILVRDSKTKKEQLCLAVTREHIVHNQSLKLLDRIQRDYENLAYLEIEGKNTGELLVDSLPSDKLA